MKIKSLHLNSDEQVTRKIVQEVLDLFDAEFEEDLSIENFVLENRVETHMKLGDRSFTRAEEIHPNEIFRAEVNRLIKKNLYRIFIEEFGFERAPWGILHGVRPTKLVHKWFRNGEDESRILNRLESDYLASEEKSQLLLEVANRQRPILHQNSRNVASVYIGIPFCVTRCLYCSFASHVLPKEEKIREFMSALEKDLLAARKSIENLGLKIQTIYIGGGTPTSLPETFFEDLLELVTKNFRIDQLEEFTVEAGRPDTISREKIESMNRAGVSRISLNPQTMNQKTLDRIGRRHSPEEILDKFRMIRSLANLYINMDTILGLPGETVEDVSETIDRILSLDPDGITIHSLALKKGSRLKLQLDDYELPPDSEVREMYRVAVEKIRSKNYLPYYLYRQSYMRGDLENVGFTRHSLGIYNIQIMEEEQTIIGIGGAATTKVLDLRSKKLLSTFHAKDLITYLRDVDYYIEKRTRLLEELYD